MERWWSALGASENHDAATFKKSAPSSSKNHTALLRAPLTYSDGFYCLLSDRATRIRFRNGVSFLMGYVIVLLVLNYFMK